jgi:monofunctional biosynthetic peptidoglycan transglycosylase
VVAASKKKRGWKRIAARVLKWTLVGGAALYLWFVIQLILLRWIDPVFTMVQAQRRVESWIGKAPRYEKRHVQVPLAKISPDLQHAVIAAEDGRFYQHHGIDWQVIEELIEDDLMEDGKLGRGGSTITQQLIKNLFATTHRSLIRKGLEFALAPAAEMILSKERILELYLNNIEWGPNGVFGAEAAALFHYKTSAARLTREQAARLAVCVPGPRKRRPQAMTRSASVILARMRQMNW